MQPTISQQALNIWADHLLNHCFGGLAPTDVVMVKGEPITWPLMAVLQDKIFQAGAVADINIVAPDNNRGKVWGAAIARHGTVEQIHRTPDWHRARYENMTKYIEILGSEQPELFAQLLEPQATELMRVDNAFKNIRLSKRWLLTLYPTQAFADMDGLSLAEYTDIIVGAATTDHKPLVALAAPLAQAMAAATTLRMETETPEGKRLRLEMNIAGRVVNQSTGVRNFPDGEVYTSPDANTPQGEIFLDLPILNGNTIIQGIYLKLVEGKIVDYRAAKGHEALKKIIETDEGARRLGEVAFGMNAGFQIPLKHPLLVEKVGGTMHIAIGSSYDHCYLTDPNAPNAQAQLDAFHAQGILNLSAQHVDVVTDFRPGGAGRAVYLDNRPVVLRDNVWRVD